MQVGTYPNVTLFDVPYIGLLDESAYGFRRIGGVYLMLRRIRVHIYMHKERKLGTSNRCSWIKLRAFRAENVSGSAMLSATTTDTTVVPHATRRRSVVNTRNQGFHKSAVVSGICARDSRKWVGPPNARVHSPRRQRARSPR